MEKATLIRTIVLFLSFFNALAVSLGWWNPLPFTEQEIEMFASVLVSFGAGIWAWWKNNSITPEAKEADRYLEDLRGKENEPKQF